MELKKTVRQIDEIFLALLQEGYSAGYLTHGSPVGLSPEFFRDFGPRLDALVREGRVRALIESINGTVGAPREGGRDYAHMEAFVVLWLEALLDEDGTARDVATWLLGELGDGARPRLVSLWGLVGLCGVHAYQMHFPLPERAEPALVA